MTEPSCGILLLKFMSSGTLADSADGSSILTSSPLKDAVHLLFITGTISIFCAVVQNMVYFIVYRASNFILGKIGYSKQCISLSHLSSLKLHSRKDGLDWTLIMFNILQALDIIIGNRDLPV